MNDIARWVEHVAEDGRPYWHDRETTTSTYDKPLALMTPMERAERATAWKTYVAPKDANGVARTYYVHDVTGETTWDVPKEIEDVREIVRRKHRGGKQSTTGERRGGMLGEETKARAPKDTAMGKEAFKEMLSAHGVKASTKWEEVVNRTKTDARFDALGTTSEKKQCLNEYQMMQTKLEREAKRAGEKKAREGFEALLEERREALGITSTSRLGKDIENALREDARWKALSNARERAELFTDFTRDLQQRELRERQQTKATTKEQFRACLIDAGVDVEMPWRKAYEAVKDDPRTAQCKPLDQLDVFEALMRQLVEEDDKAVEAERRAKAREERKRREAFVDLLRERRDDGVIQPRMRWKSFVARVQNDERYLDACQNIDGSRPRELFEDLINEIEDEIDQSLDDFEDLLHDGYKARELFGDTTWEAADRLYRYDAAWKKAPRKEARALFDKFIAKVARREEEKSKRKLSDHEDDSRSRKHIRRDRD